ncbi:DUF916 and DUF3324 domain-containing protein [Breznakia pachnodae]|uniref:DUF3324 domain-containing protein n=1 Tax=Breznakia pachnodae TaxID=265178 RepID=A0ABU0E8U2_9FIRM|nr:DUF916 and DUF3324 domain-containing protein [Breznakia pachnodae]MDQ0363292.1 hypothetical protein [Breznakia pachnodae]
MKKIKNKIKFLTILSMLIVSFGIAVTSAYAQSETPVTFSVSAIIPENQIDKNLSYFDLKMEPEMTQTIQIVITNNSNEEITSNIQINAASTGTNGVIAYSEHGIQDKSMEYSIEDIAEVATPEVVIPANKSTTVDIKLTMPKESFDGVILGGVYVTAESNIENEEVNENGFEIENKIAYALGLKLTENEKQVEPNMNLKSIEPSLEAMRTAMNIKLQNSEPIIMKNVMIDAQIYKKGENEVLHSAKTTTAEIAPNSSFDFVVDWENTKIEPGQYRLKMRIEYEDHYWEWDEEFEIKDDKASSVNDDAINIEDEFPIWIIIIIGAGILSLLLYLAFIFGKRSKKDEEEK